MDNESEIFKEALGENIVVRSTISSLIRTGRLFTYFRIEHDGKYFFFKTFTEDTPLARKLLRREYELSSGCDNPYIARTFLYGELIPGKTGILMEYVDGRTLDEFIQENPPSKLRKEIFGQLLDAVEYLHKKGIIHNDLKPTNILITTAGNKLKLIDFGLSDDDAHFLLKTPGCTTVYAAPELAADRKADQRSDVYSIGKIMKILFGGRHRCIARKCLRLNPERRYKGADALHKAWRRRNRPMKVMAVLSVAAVVALWVFAGIADRREMQLHNSRLESELQGQKEAFTALRASYNTMVDSIELKRKAAEIHEKVKNERIETFNKGIKKMMTRTEKKLREAADYTEYAALRAQYVEEVKQYYENFDKMADGEDLSFILNSLMIASLEESDRRFNKITLRRE